jgi:predicted nucleic acid-binding Zn ribbon protein
VRPIGGAIDRALRKLGLERDIARVSALDAWSDAAREVFGPAADATRAVGLSDRALVVAVPDAAWSGEIRLREGELVAAIARRATSDIVHIRAVPATDAGWHASGHERRDEPRS